MPTHYNQNPVKKTGRFSALWSAVLHDVLKRDRRRVVIHNVIHIFSHGQCVGLDVCSQDCHCRFQDAGCKIIQTKRQVSAGKDAQTNCLKCTLLQFHVAILLKMYNLKKSLHSLSCCFYLICYILCIRCISKTS